MARNKADELVKRAKAGEKFDVAAKALGSSRRPASCWPATVPFRVQPAASSLAQLSI